jgi:Glyoxalase/Bleomycin resistance protein/Dioxygenase superfamily
MSPAPHVSPRVRAYGKARIDITRRARDEGEWRRLWKDPSQPYPFKPGQGWTFNLVYTVEDYAAEIGFLIDVLGFPVLAFSPSQAQLASPEGGFALTILSAREDRPGTPPDALCLQLNVEALAQTVRELERRGVIFDQQPAPAGEDPAWQCAAFRTPHGVVIELLSEVPPDQALLEPDQAEEQPASANGWGAQQMLADEPATDDQESSQAVEKTGEQPEESQASKPQPSLWHRIPGAVGLKKASASTPVTTSKPGNGNLELTYDTLDEEGVEGDDTDLEDDFP